MMKKRTATTAWLYPATLALCATVLAQSASAQIAKVVDDGGRPFFVNAEPRVTPRLTSSKSRTNIYLPGETSLTGLTPPALSSAHAASEQIVPHPPTLNRSNPPLF